MVVTPFYDPLIAKVLVSADTRQAAIAKLSHLFSPIPEDDEEALEDRFIVQGPPNNVEFLRCVMEDEVFIAGNATTEWVDNGRVGFKPQCVSYQQLPLFAVLISIPRQRILCNYSRN